MKKLITIASLIASLTAPATLTLNHLHSCALVVTHLDWKNDIVIFTDSRGWDWAVEGIEDWCLGDYASAIFYDQGTPHQRDDVIVQLKYERVDLLPVIDD